MSRMRIEHGTLDRMTPVQFAQEIRIACNCIDQGGLEMAEKNALSMGFEPFLSEDRRMTFDFGFGLSHTVFREEWDRMLINAGGVRTNHLMQDIDGVTRLIHSFEGNDEGRLEALRMRDRLNDGWKNEDEAPYKVIAQEQFERADPQRKSERSPEPGM